LIILLAVAIYSSGKQIYDIEEQRQNGLEYAELRSADKSIKMFFSKTMHELLFIRGLPDVEQFIDEDFKNGHYKDELKEMFYDLALRSYNKYCYKDYYEITMIDDAGQEQIKVVNKNNKDAQAVQGDSLINVKDKKYFIKAMQLDKYGVYVSQVKSLPQINQGEMRKLYIIKLAVPLFNSQGTKKGVLVLSLYLSRILDLLSQDMFIYTENNKLLSLAPKGDIKVKSIDYNVVNIEHSDSDGHSSSANNHNSEKEHGTFGKEVLDGQLHKGDEKQAIHYIKTQPLAAINWIIGTKHHHPSLIEALDRIRLLSIISYIVIISLILFISYKTVQKFIELIDAQKAIIFSLVRLTEGRDPETGAHLERTRNYAVILAKQLGKNDKYSDVIDDEFVEDIFEAALLHDIGKVGIRDSILLKDSNLNEIEYDEIKGHVKIGKELLENIISKFNLKQSFLSMAKNICAYHHEKYDGTGYLEGLEGEEIPLEARIFALCDVYDVIRSKRCYKDALSHQEAVERIKEGENEHFDSDVVDAFLKCKDEFARVGEEH